MQYNRAPQSSMSVYLSIGLLISIVLTILVSINYENSFVYTWLIIYGLFCLTSLATAKNLTKLLLTTIVVSVVGTLPIYWGIEGNKFLFLSYISVFALNAYHIAYQSQGLPFDYSELFHGVWDTSVKLFVATAFTALAWLIIFIWQGLFSLIGIKLFEQIFSSKEFVTLFTSMSFCVGITLASTFHKMLRQLRLLLLAFCRLLLPLLSFIAVIFVLSTLAMSVIERSKLSLVNQYLFIWMVFLGIILINGVYQQGKQHRLYPKVVNWLVNSAILCLPVISALAIISIFNFSMTGKHLSILTQLKAYDKFYDFVICGLLLLYSLAYSLLVIFKKNNWTELLQRTNITLGAVMIIVTIMIANPWVQAKVHLKLPNQYLDRVNSLKQQDTQFFKQTGFKWQQAATTSDDSKAMIYAYQDGKPQFICRLTHNKMNYIGFVQSHQCISVISRKDIIKKSDYQLLIGPKTKASWTDKRYIPWQKKPKKKLLLLRVEHENPIYVCRVIDNNRIRIGEYQSPMACLYFLNGKAKTKAVADSLMLSTE